MVLSEYWKPLEKIFRKRLFPRFLKNDEIYKNIFSPVFSNILKEPLLVQKQTLHQQKALDISFNLAPWKWAWHYQEGATPPRRKKHILLIFYGRVEGFWLFAFYDISRRPLLSYSHFQGVKLKLRSRAFCWGIVCFCTSNGSFTILKKAREFFFCKFHNCLGNRGNKLLRKFSSSVFQYSERTISSTETNDTSAESPWSQL